MDRKRNFVNNNTTTNDKKLKICTNTSVGIPAEHFPICFLPNELILIIMENLRIYDKMSLAMTCVRFHNLFNSFKSLHKDKLVKVSENNQENFFTLFTKRNINDIIFRPILTNIEFNNFFIAYIHKKFLRMYGKGIISVSLIHCLDKNADAKSLKRVFSKFPNLENFKIVTQCSANCIRSLNTCSELKYAKLKEIDVIEFSDYAFNNFVVNAPKLITVEMNNFPKIPDNEAEVIMITNKIIPTNKELNHDRLTYENLSKVLPLSNITSFGNKEFWIKDMIKMCALKHSGFKLENLKLTDSSEESKNICGKDAIYKFKQIIRTFQDDLKRLNLDRYLNLKGTYPDRFPELRKLQNLKTLNIPNSISHDNFMEISMLTNLENLYINGLYRVRNINIQLYNVLQELPNLRILYIKDAELTNMDTYLNEKSIGLIELHLECCKIRGMKDLFQALCINHKSLRKLSLEKCIEIPGNENTEETPIIHYEKLSAIKKLTYLSFKNTDVLENVFIEQFEWNELTTLILSGNDKELTNAALSSISENCPALVDLNLAGCSLISDIGVKQLCNLSRLRRLNLMDTNVSEVGINYLVQSPCPLTECKHGYPISTNLDALLKDKLNHK